MERDVITPGIVQSRRKSFLDLENVRREVKKDCIAGQVKEIESTVLSISWRLREQASSIAVLTNGLLDKDKVISELQEKFVDLQEAFTVLFKQNDDMLKALTDFGHELASIKVRECLLHNDELSSIWKSS